MKEYLRLKRFTISISSVFLIFASLSLFGANYPKTKEFRIERGMAPAAEACIDCHKAENPGLFADWTKSRHANANITCYDCHKANATDKDIAISHYQHDKTPITAAVTPKDCSRCHPDEAKQYSISKHANTVEIMWKLDPWLNHGMNSEFERVSGCYQCHGTVLKMKGDNFDPATWPNVGVGRVNLDGSLGSCTSCHTRHMFSVMEARKPEACGQCHLGPDHPQIEIYMESKHGDIYTAHGDDYEWNSPSGAWTPGMDYRGPTCASCHMSGAGTTMTTHNVTERLSWELQAPLTVRPENFKPFPNKTGWQKERNKMKEICRQCHGNTWVDDHYVKVDQVVKEYNNVYFKPAKAKMDELYKKGLLEKTRYFDEPLEIEYYELWHHEGRRARMGTAMMAPDYSWWHGFYELKKRYTKFMEEANDLLAHNKKSYKAVDFPNATGDPKKPVAIFGK